MTRTYGFANRNIARKLFQFGMDLPNVLTDREGQQRSLPAVKPEVLNNDSGEEIPAYGCMVASSSSTDMATGEYNNKAIFSATKAASDSSEVGVFLNIDQPVPDGERTVHQTSELQVALYDGSPPSEFGTEVGPVEGQWYMGEDNVFPSHYFVCDLGDNEMLVRAFGTTSDIRCARFVLAGFPAVNNCGLIEVAARKQTWDADNCRFDTSDMLTMIQLPYYGIFPPQANIDPIEYGINPGDIVFAEYSQVFGGYVTKKCIYAGSHKFVLPMNCDPTKTLTLYDDSDPPVATEETVFDPEAFDIVTIDFQAGNICRVRDCDEGFDDCCFELDRLTQPNCQSYTGTVEICSGDPPLCMTETVSQVICVENITWDPDTGILEVTISLPTNPSGFYRADICFAAVISNDCGGLGEIESFTTTEPEFEAGMTIFPDAFPTLCLRPSEWVSNGGAGVPLPYTTTLTIDTNFPDVVPSQCCSFRVALLYYFDSDSATAVGNGIPVAEVVYKEIDCVACNYVCTFDPPSLDDFYDVSMICLGEDVVRITIDGNPGGDASNGDVMYVTLTADGIIVFDDFTTTLLWSYDIQPQGNRPQTVVAEVSIHQAGSGGPIIGGSQGTITCTVVEN